MTSLQPRIGIEHEYQIFDAEGSLDARVLLPKLTLDGRRLDPGDPRALRCRWGGVITADGREAEVATPPVRLVPGGVAAAVGLACSGRRVLEAALPPGLVLRGYSTHLNVEVDDRRVIHAGRLVATRMAPALMLLLDRDDSPGLFVRPRHERLELGGEYATGGRLAAALTFASGMTLLAARAVGDRALRKQLPPTLDVALTPTSDRFGWFVDRRAGVDDLYTAGRSCRFRAVGGGSVTAGDILAETWLLARRLIEPIMERDALDAVDLLVAGDAELPATLQVPDGDVADVDALWPTPLTDDWDCAGVIVSTVSATWHQVVFRAIDDERVRWITVPGSEVDAFVSRLQSGELDEWLRRQLSDRAGRRGGDQMRQVVGRVPR